MDWTSKLNGDAVVTVRAGDNEDLAAAERVARAALDQDGGDAEDVVAMLWRPLAGAERVRLVTADGAGVAVGTVAGHDAYLDLIAVDPAAQRRGHGAQLLDAWEREARGAGATRLLVGGNTHAYAWPGVDVRYSPAVCLLRRAGYRTTGTAVNMDVALSADMGPSDAQLERLAADGVSVRRAEPGDQEQLRALIPAQWDDAWLQEVLRSYENEPTSTFLALRDGRVLGFSSHAVYRTSWFGPIATDGAARGLGIGEVLMRLCLREMQGNGVAVAQIGWVDDAIPFYARTIGARSGRAFWLFEKETAPAV